MTDPKSAARQFDEYADALEFLWHVGWHGIAAVQEQLLKDQSEPGAAFTGMPGMPTKHYSRERILELAGDGYEYVTKTVFVSLFAQFEDTLRRLCEHFGIAHSDPFGMKKRKAKPAASTSGNWLQYRAQALSKCHNIDLYAVLPSGLGQDSIRDRELVRHCLMHNGGRASADLVREQCNPETTYCLDQPVTMTHNYLLRSFEWFPAIVRHLAGNMP